MKKFQKTNITSNTNNNKGNFTIKPLEKGFGITLGNSLRRILLSNIPGASMFAVKIKGVKHEFEAIPGIKEDATQLILNLKNLAIKMNGETYSDEDIESLKLENWPVLKLEFKGSGVIKAGDIQLPVGFEIVNKDLYLATSENDNTRLEAEIYVTRGRGFKSFIQNREEINSLGIIATDSNFSPVLHCGYSVEEIKLTKSNSNDELVINLATNGTVSPTEALSVAAKIMTAHLEQIIEVSSNAATMQVISNGIDANENIESSNSFATPISELDLSVRSFNSLRRQGIQTIQELTEMTKSQIEGIKNLGKKSLREIIKKITERGFVIKEDTTN